MAARSSTCSAMRCSPPASKPDSSTRTSPRASATTGPGSPPASRRCARAMSWWRGSSTGSGATCATSSTWSTSSPSRGVGLRILTGQGATIDTTTAAGKLVFGIFAALAEFERELIVERTRAGLGLGPGARPQGWPALQDDRRQAAPGHGRHGPARDQGRRPMPRARHHPADALPARQPARHVAPRWRQTSRPRTKSSSADRLKRTLIVRCRLLEK